MYDCVLFDLDGTLTDSAEGIINSINYALEKKGRPPVPDERRRLYVGPPLYDSFQKIDGMSPENAEECVRLYRERFNVIGWKENRVYRGIPHLLKSLKRHGVYLAVASAKPEKFTRYVVDYFGLAQYMDCISAAPMDKAGIPKSEIIRSALPDGVKSPVMVGDRMYDMIGAKQAGVRAIGVNYGYGTPQELREAGADQLVDSVEELTAELLDGRGETDGSFITFEGIDSSGKTTQLRAAAEWLRDRGWDVVETREPGGTPLGEKIRRILLDPDTGSITAECEALLFAASRAQHVELVLKPAKSVGKVVLCDRFLDSSVAFQGGGRHLGVDEVRAVNRCAVKDFSPDLTLYYDLSPDMARTRRRGGDRIENEKEAFHIAVRDAYLRIAKDEPKRIVSLDGSNTKEKLFEDTRDALKLHLKL